MIPPIQGSNLFLDSSLNMPPRENYNISGYKDPNEILQDFLDRKHNLISLVKVSDPDDETRIHGSPYKLSILNSPEIRHLGKTLISANW